MSQKSSVTQLPQCVPRALTLDSLVRHLMDLPANLEMGYRDSRVGKFDDGSIIFPGDFHFIQRGMLGLLDAHDIAPNDYK